MAFDAANHDARRSSTPVDLELDAVTKDNVATFS
jgi:hypothetical protein